MTDLNDHDLDLVSGGDALLPGDDMLDPDGHGYLPKPMPCFPTYWI